jgi:hypothetical protein
MHWVWVGCGFVVCCKLSHSIRQGRGWPSKRRTASRLHQCRVHAGASKSARSIHQRHTVCEQRCHREAGVGLPSVFISLCSK